MSTLRLFLISVLLVALLTGCDSLHYTQYVISNASPTDRVTIKQTVESSATAAGLVDKTATSRVPDTIAFYLEPVPHFPVSLGARMVGDSAVVDLSCFHPGVAKPAAFQSAESSLTTILTREFGARLTIPDDSHRVPMTQ
jgi:hypothetical protein